MTLKEKICEPFGGLLSETANELEKIAEEFAIDFAFFLGNHTYSCYEDGWSNDFGCENLSTKQLLEIFKKERGL
jgi:hypothetical protein